ncbi:MAG: phage portal protein [Methylobacter sp.]
MFKTLSQTIPQDNDYPERQHTIDVLTRVLNCELYDNLEHPFNVEYNGADEYISIWKRRPSSKDGISLCGKVVNDSVSLLFSEGHFPDVDCEDEATRETLQNIIKQCGLNALMIDAATKGSVGSVAIQLRVLEQRLFVSAHNTQFLTPIWKKTAPDTLDKIVEKYKVKGRALKDSGYPIKDDELSCDFWFHREWDATSETWMIPYFVSEAAQKAGSQMPKVPTVDKKNTITHDLGFVPWLWVRNLPGGDEIDGKCTFRNGIDTAIQIDYQKSMGGRGLIYSGDPTLVIKEPAFSDGAITKGAGNAIKISADGDAKLLEITGAATAAVIDWVKQLRESLLETLRGNRTDASKMSAAQSGRAMELMNQDLIWLADTLRISYGEGALLSLLKMIVAVSNKMPLVVDDEKIGALDAKAKLALRWPAWYAPTAEDGMNKATTLKTATEGGFMSKETAVKTIAADYDVEDTEAELALIANEAAERANIELKPNNQPTAA